MKTFFIACLLGFLALSGKLYAADESQQQAREIQQQERDAFIGRVQAERIAFLTERLELTPAKAERFWALYNTYQAERQKLINETRQKTRVRPAEGERPVFDISNLSDEDVQKLVDDRAKLIDLERQFHNDLTQLLSPQQVLAFYDAERAFQRELVNARNRGGREGTRPQGEQQRRGRRTSQ